MPTWCTWQEVADRMLGDAFESMCTAYAEQATSLLYVASGRRYTGEVTVMTSHEVDRRGYVMLGMWQPVRTVVAASIDGEAVDAQLSPAGSYVVVERHHVGKELELTLGVGQEPPASGRRACAAMAAEMAKGDPEYVATDPPDKRDNYRLNSVTRQGVTYTYDSLSSLVAAGKTGIYEADLFLSAVNPAGARYQPKVVKV